MQDWTVESDRSVLLGRVTMEPDLFGDFIELLTAHFGQVLASALQVLVDLDGFLDHDLMRAFGTSDQGKIGAGGDSLMAIRIHPDTQEEALAL